MGTSIFIAKILGPCLLIVAFGLIFKRQAYQRIMEDYCKNAALVFFGGLLALLIGLIVVLTHNLWVAGWPVLITIYGWGGIIKGIWLIVFPDTVPKFMQAYQKNKALLTVHSGIVLIFGAALTILGYF